MTKSMKVFITLLIVFAFFLNAYDLVFASDINMNLVDDTDVNTLEETNMLEDELGNEILEDDNLSDDINEGPISPSGVNSIEEEGLSFSNILSILLITVGVILILLAIAIIIRLK